MKTYDLTKDKQKDNISKVRDAISAMTCASIRLRQAGFHVASIDQEMITKKVQRDLDFYISDTFPIGGDDDR